LLLAEPILAFRSVSILAEPYHNRLDTAATAAAAVAVATTTGALAALQHC
jgi:hypothetical protein